MSGGVGYRRGQISMKNGRNEASDSALESPSAAELVSIKFLVAVDIWEGGADVTTRSYPSLWEGGKIQTSFRSQ